MGRSALTTMASFRKTVSFEPTEDPPLVLRSIKIAWRHLTAVTIPKLSAQANSLGTPPGTRTRNPLIKSQLLCQLS